TIAGIAKDLAQSNVSRLRMWIERDGPLERAARLDGLTQGFLLRGEEQLRIVLERRRQRRPKHAEQVTPRIVMSPAQSLEATQSNPGLRSKRVGRDGLLEQADRGVPLRRCGPDRCDGGAANPSERSLDAGLGERLVLRGCNQQENRIVGEQSKAASEVIGQFG